MSGLTLSLFDPPARARNTDPHTSHEAAETVDGNRNRALLLEFLKGRPAATDEEIADAYRNAGLPRQSPSGLRTRRAELVARGLVVCAGEGTTASGRKCLKWRAL